MAPQRRFVPIRMTEEDQLQRSIVDHWRTRGAPNTIVAAIPNGGARSKSTAVRMKLTGALAGMPDLLCIANGRTRYVELKARRGRLSAAQKELIPLMLAAGAEILVSKDLDEVLTFLEAWGVLRPAAIAA